MKDSERQDVKEAEPLFFINRERGEYILLRNQDKYYHFLFVCLFVCFPVYNRMLCCFLPFPLLSTSDRRGEFKEMYSKVIRGKMETDIFHLSLLEYL